MSDKRALTVMLIGAGASVAQARHQRSKGKGGSVDPPLDRSFFQRALDEEGHDREITGNIHRLREAVQQTTKYPDPFEPPSPSMEQFFADVYYEVASVRAQSDFRVYVELLRLYVNLIASTTNPIMLLRDGPIDALLATEYRAAEGNIALITFNHDLVIENALCRLLEPKGRWRGVQALYGDIPLHEVVHSTGHRFPVPGDEQGNMQVPLLKLHGSLNWVFDVTAEQPQLDEVFPKQLNRLLLLPDKITEELGLLYVYKREQDVGGERDLWPFVVPPIYDKGNLVGNEIIRNLWDKAKAVLERADRLVIFGYSLPEGDHVAIQLLRSGLGHRRCLASLVCINTDAHIVARMSEKLGARSVEFYTDVGSYTGRRGS